MATESTVAQKAARRKIKLACNDYGTVISTGINSFSVDFPVNSSP